MKLAKQINGKKITVNKKIHTLDKTKRSLYDKMNIRNKSKLHILY